MGKFLFVVCLAAFAYGNAFAQKEQKEANIWYFGYNAGLDFNSGHPVALTDGAMHTNEGCASICDTDGKLLFYSDGIRVWDRTHKTMPNGTGLMGNSSASQSCIIVPQPSHQGIYFIFTIDCFEHKYANGLQYNIVDMSANNGFGDVISKNNILYKPAAEKLTAVKHSNGTDYWIISHEMNSTNFVAYLLTAKGITPSPVKSAGGFWYRLSTQDGIGCITISSDGTKLAAAISWDNMAQLFNFNNTTGKLTYYTTLGYSVPDVLTYGVSFSPDCKKLYVGINAGTPGIYQYDMTAPDSVQLVNSGYFMASKHPQGAIQIGPDQRMYVANVSYGYMGIIAKPDLAGADCNYTEDGIELAGRTSFYGIPDLIQSFFLFSPITNDLKCAGSASLFSVGNGQLVDSIVWDFGDPASGRANTSRDKSTSHIYANQGAYHVQSITYINGTAHNYSQLITIHSGPLPDTVHRFIRLCQGDSLRLSMMQPKCTYTWNDGSHVPEHTFGVPGTCWLEMANQYCSVTDTFTTVIYQPPRPRSGDTTLCAGGSFKVDITEPGCSYNWKDGSTSGTYTMSKSGKYKVIVSNGYCPKVTDSFSLRLLPAPNRYPWKDTTICDRDSFILGASQPGCTSTWQDGSVRDEFTVKKPGTYQVTVSNGLCRNTSSINVHFLKSPEMQRIRDTVLCNRDELKVVINPNSGQIAWQDGIADSVYTIRHEGAYFVSIQNYCGRISDTFQVSFHDCPFFLYIPNAFTPGNDLLNDDFKPVMNYPPTTYSFSVFNRWGERLFSTSDFRQGWNGTFKNVPVPDDAYTFVVTATSWTGDENIYRSGIFYLFRK